MKFRWREITRNCWVATVDQRAGLTIGVSRRQTWKRFVPMGTKPWTISFLGRSPMDPRFDDLEEAKRSAEQHFLAAARRMAAKVAA